MARRLSGPNSDDDETVVNGVADDITALVNDLDDELRAVTSEIDGDERDIRWRLKVFRLIKDRGERAWLFDCVPAELPILSRLRDEYDGGQFEVVVYKNGRIVKRSKVLIEPPKKHAQYAPPSTAGNDQNAAFIAQGFSQLAEAIKEIKQIAAPIQQQINPMELMLGMFGAMAKMREIMEPPPRQHDNNFDVLLKGLELGKEFASPKGETTSADILLETVRTVLPALADIGKKETANHVANIPQNFVENRPKEVGAKMSIKDAMLKAQIENLVKCAAAGKDASLYADLILDNVPEEILMDWVTSSDVRKKLVSLVPAVGNHWSWFAQVVAIIKGELTGATESVITGNNHDNGAGNVLVTGDDTDKPDIGPAGGSA